MKSDHKKKVSEVAIKKNNASVTPIKAFKKPEALDITTGEGGSALRTRNPPPLNQTSTFGGVQQDSESKIEMSPRSYHQKMLALQQQTKDDGSSVVIKAKKRYSDQLSQMDVEMPRQEKLKVAVRVRPQLQSEVAKECVCHVGKNGKQIRVQDMTHTIEGTYDQVFPRNTLQPEVFKFVSDCIPNLLQGFNCTIFAYGQTGSGKTYTMFGQGLDQIIKHMALKQHQSNTLAIKDGGIGPTPQGSILSMVKTTEQPMRQSQGELSQFTLNTAVTPSLLAAQQQGIIPRCIAELYSQINKQGLKVTTYCSFLQIYNEKLFDLLQDTHSKHPLQIREDKFQGIYVEGLSEYIVQNEADCMVLLSRGEKNRIKRSTKMNITSSRSHSLFQLLIETDQVDAKGMLKRSKLNLGDLAGSEKINKDEEMRAKHMLELRNINLSLTTLGKIIQQLSQQTQSQTLPSGQAPHFPFRESRLTRLLQDSLGGNTKTYLIATVSPLIDNIEETISTLKFADRAKCVMQRVKRNEINAKDDALVQKLQREVQYLKELLTLRKRGVAGKVDISQQLYILKDENERLRQMAMNYDDIERMKQENKEMRLELQRLKNMAVSEYNGSNYDGVGGATEEQSPSSFDGRLPTHLNSGMRKKDISGTNTISDDQVDDLSESEDIQMQFQKYQSQADLVVIHDPVKSRAKHANDIDFGQKQRSPKSLNNVAQEPMTERAMVSGLVMDSPQRRDRSSAIVGKAYSVTKAEDDNRVMEINNLKQSRFKLQKLIEQEHKNLMQESMDESRHKGPQVKRRFRNDSTDLTSTVNQVPISLPAIHGIPNTQMVRVSSNVELRGSSQKRGAHTLGQVIQGLHKGDIIHDFGTIQKYPQHPNQQHSGNSALKGNQVRNSAMYQGGQMSSMRMSMNSINNFASGGVAATSIKKISNYGVSPPSVFNKGSLASSVYEGGILLPGDAQTITDTAGSSQYNNHNQYQFSYPQPLGVHMEDQSPRLPQTVVRIRGKNNKTIETRGSLVMTLDEEKRAVERRRQIRRSNDRLRMLENMERDRQEKIELDIMRLNQEKARLADSDNTSTIQVRKEQIQLLHNMKGGSNPLNKGQKLSSIAVISGSKQGNRLSIAAGASNQQYQ